MTDETWMLVAEHVNNLTVTATTHPDVTRRHDAIKTLAVMSLLIDRDPPGGGESIPVVEAEIVDLRTYQRAA